MTPKLELNKKIIEFAYMKINFRFLLGILCLNLKF